MMKIAWTFTILAALATAQAPQRTITPGSARPEERTGSAAPAAGEQPSPDALAEAYRMQLQRMSEAEKKNIRNPQPGVSPQGSSSFVQSSGSARPADSNSPLRPQPPASGANSGSGALPDLNRSLADLDAIRDKYIEQAGKGACPPAILMRMADLKWRLAQKGIAVASSRQSTASGDYVAIGQDWFKTGEAPAVPELRETALEDILPEAMVAAKRGSTEADEDPARMRRDYEALAQACTSAWK